MSSKVFVSLTLLILGNLCDVSTTLTTFGKAKPAEPEPIVIENKSNSNSNSDNNFERVINDLKQFIVEENRSIKNEINSIKKLLQPNQVQPKNEILPAEVPTPQRPCEALQNTYTNCEFAMQNEQNRPGLYLLNSAPLAAYCERFEQKGWMIILRRHHTKDTPFDSARFHDWFAYRNGFGNLNGDYWLGLETIHQLTKDWTYELWLQLQFTDGKKLNVRNGYFKVGNESDGYRLEKGAHLSSDDSDYGDILKSSYGMKFSTYDQDNDNSIGNCAKAFGFAWWYNACEESGIVGANLLVVENGSKIKELSYIHVAIRAADF